MRKSIAEEDEPIEVWESSKLSDLLDPEPSGAEFWEWERTDTSLGLGGCVKNPGPVRLKKTRGERE